MFGIFEKIYNYVLYTSTNFIYVDLNFLIYLNDVIS